MRRGRAATRDDHIHNDEYLADRPTRWRLAAGMNLQILENEEHIPWNTGNLAHRD